MAVLTPLIPIISENLKGLILLFQDDTIPVNPLDITYKDYKITHPGGAGPKILQQFTWTRGAASEPLALKLSNWQTEMGKSAPFSYLTVTRNKGTELVGFSLGQLLQDTFEIHPGIRMGNGNGGKNRWFGRSKKDSRTAEEMQQLAQQIRQAWIEEGYQVVSHPNLSGDWLKFQNISLPDVKPGSGANAWAKNILIQSFLKSFLIAEKLRDESIATAKRRLANNNHMHSRNQLLYGPPGTGKTYHTAVRALGILSGQSDQQITAAYGREQIRQELDNYRVTGQLEFVTFHQAFSYEDFVEGIKPVITASELEEEREESQSLHYDIERGIFRVLAERSAYALYLQQRQRLLAGNPSKTDIPPDFDTVFEALKQKWQQQLDQEKEVALATSGAEIILQSINVHGTFHFKYRKSTTENLPQTTRKGLRKINDSNLYQPLAPGVEPAYEVKHGRDRSVYRAVFRELRKLEQQMRDATSSQSPVAPSLTEALQRAVADPEIAAENIQGFDYKSLKEQDLAQAPRFVLIIDEINRGNVANIFGELITLLEKDKRAGQSEMLTAKLPYSKALFTVPDNLYLLGTMNTADRSVEALDTALRRRFSFTEMRPDADVIRKQVGSNGIVGTGTEAIDVAQILEVLNSRLEQLLDHDHCLGHALLLDGQSLDSLRTSFEHGIIPLLQEYFFADWGKIGLVLGTEFVKVIKPNTPGRRKLATFPGYDSHGMGERSIYRLTSPDAWTAAAFQSIYA